MADSKTTSGPTEIDRMAEAHAEAQSLIASSPSTPKGAERE